MEKSNLLKEAIADAKAVRETALANARMRMEEAFTPRLQSMISAKLQNEMEDEEGEEEMIDEPVEEPAEAPVDVPVEEPVDAAPVEEPAEAPVEEPAVEEPPVEEPVDVDIEAPVEEPVDIETEPGEVDIEVEPAEDEDELDLEAIIRELEEESDEDEMEEPMFTEEEDKEEEDEEEEEELDENNIETGMKTDKDVTPNLTDSGPNAGGGEQTSPDRGQPFSPEKGGEHTVDSDLNKLAKNKIYEEDFEDDEEIDLEEIIRELEEADLTASVPEEIPNGSNPFETMNEQLKGKVSSLTKDLKEHRDVIKFLKSKLNEVNLLNAKLLFTSKLFKSNNMSNNEKMKVIESFDRAKTLREVKLVYSTIAESVNKSKSTTKKNITENFGGASKPVKSTSPKRVEKKVIKEGIVSEEGAERLKQLAGLNRKK